MSAIASFSPLSNLIEWNQSTSPQLDPQTTVQSAQQTLAQSQSQILSSFVPANTSLYGAAPAIDSLLGNISTTSGLNALSQINSTRSANNQISPFTDVSQAISYGQYSEINASSALFTNSLTSSGDLFGLPASYYSHDYSSLLSNYIPQVNVTA